MLEILPDASGWSPLNLRDSAIQGVQVHVLIAGHGALRLEDKQPIE